jgi:integrase
VQTYLGVRVSDLMNIHPSNIDKKNNVIHIYMKKTKDYLSLPIYKKVEAILDKYPEGLPKISDQKYRDYIKELCKILGFDEPINQQKMYGNRVVNEVIPKWQLISSHTARRTFITLSLKNGLLPEHVMKVTGHRSRADFQKYVRITETDAHEAVKSVWDD